MSDDYRSNAPNTPPISVYNQSFGLMAAHQRIGQLRESANLRRLLNDPTLSARRPIYIAAVLLIIAAVILKSAPLLVAGLFILAIGIVPEVWYLLGMRGLSFKHESEIRRAQFLEVFEVSQELENRSALPLPFVEVVDDFPLDLPTLGMTLDLSPLPARARLTQSFGLWSYQRVRRHFYLRAAERGVYHFGPTTLRVTDPFGVLTREEQLDTETSFIVHPLIVPIEQLGLEPKALFGEHRSTVRLLEDPLRLAGVREYAPGDDPRRIHWKASARAGTLQSKLLDPSTQRIMMIALDVRTFKAAQMGYDPALCELAISTAASLAMRAFNEGYAVGVVANSTMAPMRGADGEVDALLGGEPRLRLAPAAQHERISQILDGLARLLPYSSASLAATLTSERHVLPPGASLVYIGLESLVDVPTLIALRELRTKGRDVKLLLTRRDEEVDEAAEDIHLLRAGMFDTHYIGGRATWKSLLATAVGELPLRRASAPLDENQLTLERAILAERRRQRRAATAGTATAAPQPTMAEEAATHDATY